MKDEKSNISCWIENWNLCLEADGEDEWVIDPSEILKDMKIFDKESNLTVKKEGNEIHISDDKGNIIIYPQDSVETAHELRGFIKFEDDYPILKYREDGDEKIKKARASVRIVVDLSEVKKAVLLMESTEVDYCDFTFSKNDKSFARFGYQGDKKKLKKRGKVMIYPKNFDSVNENETFIVHRDFTNILSVISGEVEIFSHPGSVLVVFVKHVGDGKKVTMAASKSSEEE
ncbi:MAG: hypothetical protein ACTSRU_12975 [Candidatus Hodarchaeales archaeon]